jgi:hypothetical protein
LVSEFEVMTGDYVSPPKTSLWQTLPSAAPSYLREKPHRTLRAVAATYVRTMPLRLRLLLRAGLERGALPNALVIGAAKAGTTSVYRWLCQHPGICASYVKEILYFNDYHKKGSRWYAAHFAPQPGQSIRMEASPGYLWDPCVPERVKRLLGTPKLIVLLREPVDRAWSQYWMNVRGGGEKASFPEALRRETALFGQAGQFSPDLTSHDVYRNRSYLGKGVYAPQLERWLSVFPHTCFHFIRSEDMFRSPHLVLSQLLRFLDLAPVEMTNLRPHNDGRYPPLDAELRRELQPIFSESNARVEQLTGIRWP